MILHLRIKCHKNVSPQLVEETLVFSCLEITFEQKWVIANEHIHEAPRPEILLINSEIHDNGCEFTFLIVPAVQLD